MKVLKGKCSQLPVCSLISHRTPVTEDATVVDASLTETMRECTRIQQPSVRINPNLMKIKMDVDYNPIILPKEENSEKNEIGNELQSAFLQMVKLNNVC